MVRIGSTGSSIHLQFEVPLELLYATATPNRTIARAEQIPTLSAFPYLPMHYQFTGIIGVPNRVYFYREYLEATENDGSDASAREWRELYSSNCKCIR